ncbi:hypothetical protein CK203_073125 [Vitis vinifera]|uniref:Endonuclease/exonuclease/phosphatase domain-containing protein n=1 Tax=Vitis vinifera TaxID=29760 RepID=A0A438BY24_VITVI|nr:hypothetical protein CK203_073125 [Vitis vinifera]
MRFRMLTWNVRGANNCDKRKVIKALIKKQKVDLVCLQETKIQDMSKGIIRSLGVGRYLEWGAVDSRGAAGGIVVFWDNRVLDLVDIQRGVFSISCIFKNNEDGFMWMFTGVYGPTLRRERESFWEELGAIKGIWDGPWCAAGDFNAILSPEERNRGGRMNSNMRRFLEIIEDLELKDVPLVGGPFTWNGGVNNQTFSRLDRFLFNEGWDNHFGDVRQCVLPRPVSDHFPILLDVGGGRRGPSPFRFENMWLKVEGIKELMKSWWEGVSFNGSASFMMAEKIKVLKVKLKEWNRDSFGRIELRKNAALEQVQIWDAREKLAD